MAVDLTLGSVASGYSLSVINSNNDLIETALQDALSRSGNSPNQMEADLDMNSFSILNLPTPVNPTDPVRLQDVGSAPTSASEAAVSAAAALVSETNSAASEAAAAISEANALTYSTNAAANERGVAWDYSNTTTMSDPGTSTIRLNNATLASVTAIAVSKDDWETNDVSDYVAVWGASTNTNKGTIVVRKVNDSTFFAVYNITASVTDSTAWLQLTVSHVDSSGTITDGDRLYLHFTRSGDQGASGGGSGDMVSTNNLSDLTSASSARSNLGLGALATLGAVSATEINTNAVTSDKIIADAVTLAKMAAGTAGNIITYDASGNPAAVATGTAGQVLTSNGAGAAPTMEDVVAGITSVVQQKFTTSGTYTPTSGMVYCIVEVVGGGGGGGKSSTDGSYFYGGGGGGAGGYARSVISAASIGASQTVTIGAAGTGGTTSTGGTGGTSSLGALVVCPGGAGGAKGAVGAIGGAGGTPSAGDLQIKGGHGRAGRQNINSNAVLSGEGGDSKFGYGGYENSVGGGAPGTGYGSGGSGAAGTVYNGGAGAAGLILITEYIG